MRRATTHMPHAPCYNAHATMRHVTHVMLISCTYVPLTQLQRAVSSSSPYREHHDSSRGRPSRSANRHTPYSSHHRRRSRSVSPASPTKQPPLTKPPFRSSAATSSPSACAICLGRHRHNIRACNSATTFDGGEAKTRRGENGRLICISSGFFLCSDWQRPARCPVADHPKRHLCSGCEKPDHGAQDCPRAQKP